MTATFATLRRCPGSPAVQDAAQQQLERIYGRQASLPGFQYLALHMRLGGMDTEESLQGIVKGGANGTLTDLIEGVMCIRKLGASRLTGLQPEVLPLEGHAVLCSPWLVKAI